MPRPKPQIQSRSERRNRSEPTSGSKSKRRTNRLVAGDDTLAKELDSFFEHLIATDSDKDDESEHEETASAPLVESNIRSKFVAWSRKRMESKALARELATFLGASEHTTPADIDSVKMTIVTSLLLEFEATSVAKRLAISEDCSFDRDIVATVLYSHTDDPDTHLKKTLLDLIDDQLVYSSVQPDFLKAARMMELLCEEAINFLFNLDKVWSPSPDVIAANRFLKKFFGPELPAEAGIPETVMSCMSSASWDISAEQIVSHNVAETLLQFFSFVLPQNDFECQSPISINFLTWLIKQDGAVEFC